MVAVVAQCALVRYGYGYEHTKHMPYAICHMPYSTTTITTTRTEELRCTPRRRYELADSAET